MKLVHLWRISLHLSRQASAGAQQASAGAQQQSAAMEQVFNLIKNLEEMAKELNDSFIEYRKGLKLEDKHRVMLKDARKVVIQLADTTAFANANLGEIEVLMKETVAKHNYMELLAYVDSRGIPKVATVDVTKADDVSHRDYFKAAMKGDFFLTEPYISTDTDDFCITAAAPVRDASGSYWNTVS